MNVKMLVTGITLMILAAVLLIFGPDLTTRVGLGIFLLFIIGLGLTVAGSPDPNEGKHDVRSL